ncbi:UNVERIFIED_ORG: hypothetical protein BCL66_105245 [Martelella mediterranea]
MRITSAHKSHGAGHAWVDTETPIAAGDSVIIERDTEKNRFLGPEGWQHSSTPLPVEAIEGSRVLLGPTIVNALRDGDFIKIRLPASGFEQEDFWPSIPVTRRAASGAGVVGGTPKTPSPAADVVDADPPPPPPVPEAPPMPAEQRSWARNPLLIVLIVLLFLAILGTAGYLLRDRLAGLFGFTGEKIGRVSDTIEDLAGGLFGDDDDEDTTTEVGEEHLQSEDNEIVAEPGPQGGETAAETPMQQETQTTAPEPEGNGAPATAATPETGGAVWIELLRDDSASGERLYQAYGEAITEPEGKPYAMELLNRAAQLGDLPAEREYAELFDPTLPASDAIEVPKNARTALEYYEQLQQQGQEQAKIDIERVCGRLKSEIYTDANARTTYQDHCDAD